MLPGSKAWLASCPRTGAAAQEIRTTDKNDIRTETIGPPCGSTNCSYWTTSLLFEYIFQLPEDTLLFLLLVRLGLILTGSRLVLARHGLIGRRRGAGIESGPARSGGVVGRAFRAGSIRIVVPAGDHCFALPVAVQRAASHRFGSGDEDFGFLLRAERGGGFAGLWIDGHGHH